MAHLIRRLLADDDGQDLVEYALLTGLVAVAAVLVFPLIQTAMAEAYQGWNDNAYAIWEAPPPSGGGS